MSGGSGRLSLLCAVSQCLDVGCCDRLASEPERLSALDSIKGLMEKGFSLNMEYSGIFLLKFKKLLDVLLFTFEMSVF